ncbi:hypothetical protein QTI17_22905 [Variovorax sp. J31P179]|uniref:hypothetical protein n=1 Tax=Variovorax sp. J31P179 TaxID=3053508 RepID=UPI0025778F2D|nr:hypothetical protein [Variovorax sp. J31P179]MDM0083449.1 hypothetical protein [Variovorax sp. J31P179]
MSSKMLLAMLVAVASAGATAADYTAPGQLSPASTPTQKIRDAASKAAREAQIAAQKAADAAKAAAEQSKVNAG